MPLRLLIIHEIKTVTRLIHYIRAEYSDAVVDWFSSALDASMILQNNKYDSVLCGLEMAHMNGIAFKKNWDASLNQSAPFIILTSSESENQRQELAGHGIHHILPLPCTSLQLRNMIDKVTDPRGKRIHTRYSIPDTRAVIRFGDRDIQTEVINISTDGILCEFNCPRPAPDLTTAGRMSVHLPAEYSTSVLQDVIVSLLRLTVRSWHHDQSTDRISIAFRFNGMSKHDIGILESAFEKAGWDLLE